MIVKKGGIFKNIPSKEFGIYQQAGFVKVIDEVVPEIKEEPVVEDIKEEIVIPKSKKKK